MLIQPNGEKVNGRPLNQVGAHVEGHNTGNLGICLIGTDKFLGLQFAMLRGQIDNLLQNFFQILKSELYCHNQFDTAIKQGKCCPGFPVNVLLTWYWTHDESLLEPYKFKGMLT